MMAELLENSWITNIQVFFRHGESLIEYVSGCYFYYSFFIPQMD